MTLSAIRLLALLLCAASPAMGQTYSLTPLGDLPEYHDSGAFGLNEAGQVVGTSDTAEGSHAFIWDSVNGMRDLNDLIDPGLGWTLLEAADINNRGQIVGFGSDGTDLLGFLLTPD
jgi:probable HAF family extracellular repeat protein